ncbi:hypothetical protein BJV78DRAFT_944852 [Lactifluus subvellereus]|nr:hypothetical protein BJV78DRAFT_944852 [Lactifluus subvellereus]
MPSSLLADDPHSCPCDRQFNTSFWTSPPPCTWTNSPFHILLFCLALHHHDLWLKLKASSVAVLGKFIQDSQA